MSIRNMSIHRFLTLTSLAIPYAVVLASQVVAAPPQSLDNWRSDFESNILPIFKAHCFDCHGPDVQESDLRLDQLQALRLGGESGEPAIIPGSVSQSHLVQLITTRDPELVMPPDRDPLSPDDVEKIKKWIELAPPWQDSTEFSDANQESSHWSFQPLAPIRISAPISQFAQNPIDVYVEHALAAAEIVPNEVADKTTLVRRLYLDVIGLPPGREIIQNFLNDNSPIAYEKLVDRLLADPGYGERFGRYWLDLVRFGETDGYETNRERPHAWPFRDYVIDSMNSDKPYSRILREHLAGDVLDEPVGTGFLVAGMRDIVESPDPVLTLTQRQNELDDMLNTTSTVMLGMTVGCARCHNHKFDPISQTDYYALQAIFAGVRHGDRAIGANPDSIHTVSESFPAISASRVRFQIESTTSGEPCIDEFEIFAGDVNVAAASFGTMVSSSGNLPGYDIHRLEHVNDGLYGNEWSWISDTPSRGWLEFEFPSPQMIDQIVWSRDRTGKFSDRLVSSYRIEVAGDLGQWKSLLSSQNQTDGSSAGKPQEVAYAGNFHQPEPTRRLFRGDPMAPREEVHPNAPRLLGDLRLSMDTPESLRRESLADWITDPDNPLTARVIVNRLWQHHFGIGIVSTPSDFGAAGTVPSHPELLDYLAAELLNQRWSLKSIHRQILLSAAYRRSSLPNPEAMKRDASNVMLWRFTARRLEAEAIRDSVLTASGTLDRRMGGPGFSAFEVELENVRHYHPKKAYGPDDWRRMVYMTKVRQEKDSVFGIFDCPDGSTSTPTRGRSTTPLQSLNLFNSRFMVEQSDFLAEHLRNQTSEIDQQIELAFWRCYGRPPSSTECSDSKTFVEQFGLPSFCRSLLNSNEFLFLP